MRRTLLSKYDEFLEGPKELVCTSPGCVHSQTKIACQGFRLGSSSTQLKSSGNDAVDETTVTVNKSLLSIDYSSECGFEWHTTESVLTHWLDRKYRND